MDIIKNYIENLFYKLPQNNQVLEMKQQVIVNANDRYKELLRDGIDEHTAVGIVLDAFKNVESKIHEIGIQGGQSRELDLIIPKNQVANTDEKMHVVDMLHGVMWTGISGVYMLLGFLFDLWHPGWIIFLLGAMISIYLEYLRGK